MLGVVRAESLSEGQMTAQVGRGTGDGQRGDREQAP
jgi:hypothetical protein